METTTTATATSQTVAYFELAVSLYLWRWPALTLAVQNEWGGHDSAEKRDWLAGVLADMFTQAKSTTAVEVEDVEEVAAQVLMDEFQTVLEDDSAYDLAVAICNTWKDCQEGRFEKIQALKTQFENSKPRQKPVQRAADDSDSSGTDAEVDDDDAAPSRPSQQSGDAMDIDDTPSRSEPVIDDDGFELVQAKGKKSRK